MTGAADAFAAIELTQLPDILDCTTDDSKPILFTRAAIEGSDADLLACNRGIVNRVIDYVDRPEEISADALRSMYVELYARAAAELGWSAYRTRVPREVQVLALQGLALMDAPEHLALAKRAVAGEVDDAEFARLFPAAEAAHPLAHANAEFLRGLSAKQIISERNFEVAFSLALGRERGAGADLLKWTGDLADLPA